MVKVENQLELFQIVLRNPNNPSVMDRTEYLRCQDEETVLNGIKRATKFLTSEYYGFTSVIVFPAKKFPELKTLSVNFEKFPKKEKSA